MTGGKDYTDLLLQYREQLEKYIKEAAKNIQKQRSLVTADFLEELLQKEKESEELLQLPEDFLEVCIWSYKQLGNKEFYSIPVGAPIITENMAETLDEIRQSSEEEFKKILRELVGSVRISGERFKEQFLGVLLRLLMRRARKILYGKQTKNALWFEEALVSIAEQEGN